ncbi:MAG TPA: hypothetical protein DD670_06510 [Planctomycetaceae bacterium]|nr:hypothetical protein [Planctomycetaceae bacterium]
MNVRMMACGLVTSLLIAWQVQADSVWAVLEGDPALWPYADGPNVETVALPHSVYRMAGVVGVYEGKAAIFSVGGRAQNSYFLDTPGESLEYSGNRQSHFSIYRRDNGWVSADGTDDQDNGNGTWTSVGLTGYNNGNGSLSPVVSQGTGYVADQGFYFDDAVYVYGGYPQWGGQMARYDITSNTWSQVALGDDDGLYANGGGGLIGDQWYKVHREGFLMHYNAATDAFEADIAITGLINPGFGAVTGVIGDALYILDTDGSLYAVDPVNAVQFPKAPAPTAVREAGSVVYEGKLYVLGGKTDSSNTTAIDRIQIYDPQTDTWVYSSVDMPDARSGFLSEILDDTLYIGNGLNNRPDDQLMVLNDFFSISMEAVSTPVPEPCTLAMVCVGLFGVCGLKTRRLPRGRAHRD